MTASCFGSWILRDPVALHANPQYFRSEPIRTCFLKVLQNHDSETSGFVPGCGKDPQSLPRVWLHNPDIATSSYTLKIPGPNIRMVALRRMHMHIYIYMCTYR